MDDVADMAGGSNAGEVAGESVGETIAAGVTCKALDVGSGVGSRRAGETIGTAVFAAGICFASRILVGIVVSVSGCELTDVGADREATTTADVLSCDGARVGVDDDEIPSTELQAISVKRSQTNRAPTPMRFIWMRRRRLT
jgi:hypothetical protein